MEEKVIDLKDRSDELSGCEPGTTKKIEGVEIVVPKVTGEGKKTEIPDYNKGKKFFDGFTEDRESEKITDEIIKENYPEKFKKPNEPEKTEETAEIEGNILKFKRPK